MLQRERQLAQNRHYTRWGLAAPVATHSCLWALDVTLSNAGPQALRITQTFFAGFKVARSGHLFPCPRVSARSGQAWPQG
jgi:hypothetical protein